MHSIGCWGATGLGKEHHGYYLTNLGKLPSTLQTYSLDTCRFRIWCSIWRAFLGDRPNKRRPLVRRSSLWMVRRFFKLYSLAKIKTTVLWRYRPQGWTCAASTNSVKEICFLFFPFEKSHFADFWFLVFKMYLHRIVSYIERSRLDEKWPLLRFIFKIDLLIAISIKNLLTSFDW